MQAIGEPLDLIEYNTWNVLLPEGEFLTRVGASNFEPVLQQVRGLERVRSAALVELKEFTIDAA